jgi:hypothetical protein
MAADVPFGSRGGQSLSVRRSSQKGGEAYFAIAIGMEALARTPVLPEATLVSVLSAQLRRPRPRSATGALRRLRSSAALNGVPPRSSRIGGLEEGPLTRIAGRHWLVGSVGIAQILGLARSLPRNVGFNVGARSHDRCHSGDFRDARPRVLSARWEFNASMRLPSRSFATHAPPR